MKKLQVFLIKQMAKMVKKSINNSEINQTLNLFNTGITLDLNKVKERIVEIGEGLILKKVKRDKKR